MTVVAVTGHRDLADPAAVRAAIDDRLAALPGPLVGLSALAEGADQVFAEAVLALGGRLEVVLPGADYLESLRPEVRVGLERLLTEADAVTQLDFDEVGQDAYVAAGLFMLRRCDVLLAVWDGGRGAGPGGTGDIVARAREAGVPVIVVDATRDSAAS